MRISLERLTSSQAKGFLDYFRAELRSVGTPISARDQVDEEGTYSSSTTIALHVGGQNVPVTWSFEVPPGASGPTAIEVSAVEGSGMPWDSAAAEVVERAIEAVLADVKAEFFRRRQYSYTGPALSGEYWLSDFRFAPALRDDEDPAARLVERVVVIDQVVEAIDEAHAGRLAVLRAEREAARLSLILDRPILRPLPEIGRWALVPTGNESSELEYRRVTPALPPTAVRTMPREGELCGLGKYDGSFRKLTRREFPLLALPKETPAIFRSLERVEMRAREAFDACARLYQVGQMMGRRWPTAGLAYNVAAVDALATRIGGGGTLKAFKAFVEPRVQVRYDLSEFNDMLKRLWGRVRSAHFHGGSFRFSELAWGSVDLDGPDRLRDEDWFIRAHLALRSAIVSWTMDEIVAANGPEASAADPPGS